MIKPLLPAIALLLVSAAPAPLGGSWAGDGFLLRAAPTGMLVQTGCRIGKIETPIVPDKAGNFTATGYLNAPTTGYRLSDVAPRDRMASFKGRVAGNSLALTVQVEGQPATSYRLVRGASIKFPKCK